MKSLSSSRREVLVDCFHVYTYHIGYLLPGSAVIKYPMRKFNDFRNHGPTPASNAPLLSCSG